MADALSAIAAVMAIGKGALEASRALRLKLSQPKLYSDEFSELWDASMGLEGRFLDFQHSLLDLNVRVLEHKGTIFELEKEQAAAEHQNLKLQEDLHKLSERNAQAEREERELLENRQAMLERYEKKQMGNRLVAVDAEFRIQCFDDWKASTLYQISVAGEVTHVCSRCKAEYNLAGQVSDDIVF